MRHVPRFADRFLLPSRGRGPTASRRSSHRRRSAGFRLEHLEDRTLLSMVTTLADGGPGSLRQAILDANATPGADVIDFAPDLQGTITLSGDLGELLITDDLTIIGMDPAILAISGDYQTRVFHISPDTTVAISGLTITQGLADKDAIPPNPGAGVFGGGILNQGDLTLTGVIVSDNWSVGDVTVTGHHTGGGAGGGVSNFGTLTVIGSTFIGNKALGADGTVGGFAFLTQPPNLAALNFPGIGIGGGIWNGLMGEVSVADSHFIDNLAQGGSNCLGTFAGLGQGGAIYNDNSLAVARSSFSGNRAIGGSNNRSDVYSGEAVGGAIASGTQQALMGSTNIAVLTVNQSTFSHNQAVGGDDNLGLATPNRAYGPGDGLGGGIFVFQGEATISQSVVEHNLAIGGRAIAGVGGVDQRGSLGVGGGIFFFDFLGGVKGTIEGSRIEHNEAIGGPGASGVRGGDALGGGLAAGTLGGPYGAPGTVMMSDTIVSDNLARGGQGGVNANGGDGQGGGVYNDAGSTTSVTTSRIAGNQAVEGGGVANFGDLTLSHVVVSDNMAVGDANVIPDPDKPRGSGPGIATGGGVHNRGTLTVTDSTFARNEARGASDSDGRGVYLLAGVSIGGGLANYGEATVTNSQFTSNRAQGGDGGKNASFAGVAGGGAIGNVGLLGPVELTVSGSRFMHNQAAGGNDNESASLPGFGVGGAIFSHRFSTSAMLEVRDSIFGHNQAIGGNDNRLPTTPTPVNGPNFATGGGIFIAQRGTTVTISGSTFEHNRAIGGQGRPGDNGGDGHGGGIGGGFVGTTVEVLDSTFEHNQAIGGRAGHGGKGGDARGGGIFNESGANLTVVDTTVEHNMARGGNGRAGGRGGDGLGGGLYNDANSTLALLGATVEFNLALGGGPGGQGIGGGIYPLGAFSSDDATVIRKNRASTRYDNIGT